MRELPEIYKYYNHIMHKIYKDEKYLISTNDKLREEFYTQFTDMKKYMSALKPRLPLLVSSAGSLDITTAIFHIYDNNPILNDEYGGSRTNYDKVLHFFENIYTNPDLIYNKSKMSGVPNYHLQLLYDINNLNEFFTTKKKDKTGRSELQYDETRMNRKDKE